MPINVSERDIQAADKFLTAYLTTKIPAADFSPGSAVRDFVIGAVAQIFAYLENERKTAREYSGLLSLGQLEESEEVDDAVDAVLSNWFLTRKNGTQALLTATLHFSRSADIVIDPTTRFFRTSALAYFPVSTERFVIPARDLRATVDTDGTIIDYTYDLSLIANTTGEAFNVTAGRFAGADTFSPYFLYAENQEDGQSGKGRETTSELLARAPTAISVRNLVNSRSVDAVLRERFPGIERLLTIGFGDPEMTRDLTDEAVSGLKMHQGGHVDIYVGLGRTEVVETLTVGAAYALPGPLPTVLRDGAGFAGVLSGDVVRISAGLPDAPREYVIKQITGDQLVVQPRAPFALATDELSIPGFVTYSVGSLLPSFDNLIPSRATGETSRSVTTSGLVRLSPQPVYRIRLVEVLDGSGNVVNTLSRTNLTPDVNTYTFENDPAGAAQSDQSPNALLVDSSYDGQQLRVTYDTLVGYKDINTYVRSQFERVIASNPLVRGYHPIYVSASFTYRRKSSATQTYAAATIQSRVAQYINAFDWTENLDVSSVTEFVRTEFPDIGVIYPFNLVFTLMAPDGQVYTFTTKDEVTIDVDRLDNAARLTNGLVLRTPISNADLDPLVEANHVAIDAANTALQAQLQALGVSNRTVRYLTTASDVTATEVV